jgi:hypothetical protein
MRGGAIVRKIPTVTWMMVTSQNDGANGGEVCVFHHEADGALRAIAEDFERGKLSPRQARRRLLTYQEFVNVPDLDFDGDFAFPFRSDDYEYRPATEAFEHDAVALGIPGVDYSHGTDLYGNRFQFLEVRDDDALEELQRRMKGRYRIVGSWW